MSERPISKCFANSASCCKTEFAINTESEKPCDMRVYWSNIKSSSVGLVEGTVLPPTEKIPVFWNFPGFCELCKCIFYGL